MHFENAGSLDINGEIKLWTRAGHIKIKVGTAVDVRALNRLITHAVLGAELAVV